MERHIRSLALFSASGFVLSLFIHILGLFNKVPSFGWLALLLHFGIFAALFGAVVAYFRLRRSEGKGFWKRILKASPVWMRWLFLLFLTYSLFNFAIFWNELFNLRGKSSDEITAILLRGFSGHWMLIYFGTFVLFYSMQSVQENATSRI